MSTSMIMFSNNSELFSAFPLKMINFSPLSCFLPARNFAVPKLNHSPSYVSENLKLLHIFASDTTAFSRKLIFAIETSIDSLVL